MKDKRFDYVTCPTPKQYSKRKHVVCVNSRICNRNGATPNSKCVDAKCPYAVVKDYVCDITPVGFYRGMKFEDLGI